MSTTHRKSHPPAEVNSFTRRKVHRPRKSLGQFFLKDSEISRQIASLIPQDAQVIEIGPGDGALTNELLAANHRVIGIEVDSSMVSRLQHRFEHRRDFRLISEDILKIDWKTVVSDKRKNVIVGNLPYHLVSSILFAVFGYVRCCQEPHIDSMIVMVQSEVGRRITAHPRTKDYGSLTLLTQFHGFAEYMLRVPAESFYPIPAVDGGIIRILFRNPETLPKVDYEQFRRIVRGCFSQRRKMMRNALGVINDLPDNWQNLDFDFTRRAEEFTFEEFVSLTNNLYDNDPK